MLLMDQWSWVFYSWYKHKFGNPVPTKFPKVLYKLVEMDGWSTIKEDLTYYHDHGKWPYYRSGGFPDLLDPSFPDLMPGPPD